MTSLHLIRTSAFNDNKLASALRMLKSNDNLVLLDDGVYNINHPLFSKAKDIIGAENIFVIEHHYQARGLSAQITGKSISMAELVTLTDTATQIITWQ